jgi:hypothetical protein
MSYVIVIAGPLVARVTPLLLSALLADFVDMGFELLGEIEDITTIAVNLSIRERRSLKGRFGGQRWRKLKGVALVRFPKGEVRRAEVHWYEAHGMGDAKQRSNVFWTEADA